MNLAGNTDIDNFISPELKNEFVKVNNEINSVENDLSECHRLIENLKIIKMTDGQKFESIIDLGCDTHVHAEVAKDSMIFIDIGYSFYLEMHQKDVVPFVMKRIALLEERQKSLASHMEGIRVRINDAIEIISSLSSL